MKKFFLTILISFFIFHLTISTCISGVKNNGVSKAIVKVHTVSSEPDYDSPWQMSSPVASSGSGCIIGGNRILTNAHVVSNQKFIQVQLHGSPDRYNAEVSYVSHEADLAILTVEDETFFSGIEPLSFGDLPEALNEVLVYGYPVGGDSLSITRGILSRIVYDSYAHSGDYFMAGQIDAAINPGNSGGPVIVNGKVVGIAMQTIDSEDTESLGYMIPSPLIKHFLKDIDDGTYDGFPGLGFFTQKMISPSLRQNHKVPDGTTGVLVTRVFWNSPAKGILKKGDVVISIDGQKIANNKTVEFRPEERIHYAHLANMHQVGDKISLNILRNGKMENIKYSLNLTDIDLVAETQYDQLPRYFIFAGMIFSPLSVDLICTWEDCDAPQTLISEWYRYTSEEKQEVIVAIYSLPAEINKGYHNISAWVVETVNGNKCKNFKQFYELVINATEDFIIFENEKGQQIVIDRNKANESHQAVLETYNIKADQSPDLL